MSDPCEGMGRSTRVNINVHKKIDNPRQVSMPESVFNISNYANVFAFRSSRGEIIDDFQVAPTLLIPVEHGRTYIRALLDTGSSSSFVTEDTLRLVPFEVLNSDVSLNIRTLHGETREKSKRVKIRLPGNGGELSVVCYVVPHIASLDPGTDQIKSSKLLAKLSLNDPPTTRDGVVNIILGTPNFWEIVKGVHCRINKRLVILDTIYGRIACGSDTVIGRDVIANAITADDLNKKFEKIWEIESFPRDNSEAKLTMDEIAAVESMEKNLVFNSETGRFRTRLLWKGKPDLINNYAAAKVRLDGLMRRLRKDPEVKAAYKAVIQDYFDKSTVEEVTGETLTQLMNPSRRDLYFLPHRAVYDSKRVSTKCRVVMDASAKTGNGKSLNDCLLPGPPLQQQIVAVELRFRSRRIALIGDCKKMFLQIEVDPKDRPFLRFLWHDPDDVQATPKVYQFKTLIFGATDSPFQAISCFRRLVADRRRRGDLTALENRVCDTIERDTYVDDVTTGGDTVEDALNDRVVSEGPL